MGRSMGGSMGGGGGRWLRAGCAVILLGLSGCELQETTVAVPEDVILAEVFLSVLDEGGRAVALLHRTVGGRDPVPLDGARVRLVGTATSGSQVDTFSHVLDEQPLDRCVEPPFPPEFGGRCYEWEDVGGSLLRPGATVRLEVDLPRGGRLEGLTTIPGDFQLWNPSAEECTLAPDTPLPLVWGQAQNAWAYVVEGQLYGLPQALESEGIPVESDPLPLLGLSVSQADTSLTFPSELGLFDRFQEDRDLLVRLQRGLPDGSWATVWLGAVDRNWANWIRGGNFNPSGQVRVPSVFGDGTGVFGSSVVRSLLITTPGGGPATDDSCGSRG
ncbi:MAG: hypothetical protein WEA09_14720 [Gemmatimonadota bacterium]